MKGSPALPGPHPARCRPGGGRRRVADLNERYLEARRADSAFARRVNGRSATPTGRTTYRLFEELLDRVQV